MNVGEIFIGGLVIASLLIGNGRNPVSSPANSTQPVLVKNSSRMGSVKTGWITLFDGSDASHWRSFKKTTFNWEIKDGALSTPGGKGDLVTNEAFGNFELEFDWKIAKAGNSGVLYRVVENGYEKAHMSGPEYQISDAENRYATMRPEQFNQTQFPGGYYGFQAPSVKAEKPFGEWNHGKIVARNGHIEHWLNGKKVVDYQLWTDQWKKTVSESKFKDYPGYGMAKSGHIALQDHGDAVAFRNIRIRELTDKLP